MTILISIDLTFFDKKFQKTNVKIQIKSTL